MMRKTEEQPDMEENYWKINLISLNNAAHIFCLVNFKTLNTSISCPWADSSQIHNNYLNMLVITLLY